MNTLLKFFVIIFTLTIHFLKVYSQTYDFRNFSLEDGLPQSQVLSMCQDKDGNIWMGTNSGGVGKYDGNTFQNYTENDGLINNVVFAITEIKNKLFFGTNGGLSIYDGKKFKNYTTKNGLTNDRIYSIFEDNSGTIWIGTQKGICIFENEKIIAFNVDSTTNNIGIKTIYQDHKSNMWFGTQGNGIIKLIKKNKTFNYFNKSCGLIDNYIFSINSDIKGNMYIGTSKGSNKINTSGKVEKTNIPKQENKGFYSILSDKQNNIWFASADGLYKYDGNSCKSFSIQNGLPGNILLSILFDREENLWIGTSGCGVSRFSSEAFKSYSSLDQLPGDYIQPIFQDSKKNMWLGVAQYGAVKLVNQKAINYHTGEKNTINTIIDDEVQSICEDNEGNIYFGTKNGLSVFDGKNFKNYTLPSNNIYSIIKDHNGKIWIGTKNGLYSFYKNNITSVLLNGLNLPAETEIPIYCILEKDNSLWLGSEKGIIKYSENAVSLFNSKSGFTDKRVSSIIQDNNNNLWFGTDEGIFKYDTKKFYSINEKSGLTSNKVYLLLLDNSNLWIGTNKGLDKLDLLKYHSDKIISIKHYGKEEGFKGLECNQNAAFKDTEGNLWFGTIKGAFVFNPKQEKINLKEPVTQITGIRLFFENADQELKNYSNGLNKATLLPNDLVLPYDKNHITFDFIGICMTAPSKVKYQFKLEGADNNWFPPTSKTEATYSSLSPGNYTFYLKAMNNDGLWNKEPVIYKFSILPPWWKTWWFYAICAIVAFLLLFLFISLRTRNLKEAKLKLEEEVELRTHQLREEKEKVELINKEVIHQKGIIEGKNQDIMDSIKYAKNIQEAILPPLVSLHQEFKDAFVLYQPKDIVSGDFYWFTKRNNKRFIAACDCTGHGVPGAFMSIVGNTLLNEIVAEKNISEPAKILDELHNGVKEALKQNEKEDERKDGMDIALCSLNEDSTLIEYAGANRPLWIFRKNKSEVDIFEVIKPDKFPIGGTAMEHKRMYTNHIIPVEKGDILYMFSDGYADQFGGDKGKKFMVGNLQKKVATIYHLPIEEQQKELEKTFNEWKGNLEQVDDVLVIAFRI